MLGLETGTSRVEMKNSSPITSYLVSGSPLISDDPSPPAGTFRLSGKIRPTWRESIVAISSSIASQKVMSIRKLMISFFTAIYPSRNGIIALLEMLQETFQYMTISKASDFYTLEMGSKSTPYYSAALR